MTDSGFIYAHPTWWSGAARLVDLSGSFDEYNQSDTGPEADARARANDARLVLEDLRAAFLLITDRGQTEAHSA